MLTFSQINELVRDNIYLLLDKLEIEYFQDNRYLSFPCPIHGGDNGSACCLFVGQKYQLPVWKCYTSQCEDEYGKTLIGFISGVLSTKNDKDISIREAIKWILNSLNIKDTYKVSDKKDVSAFLNMMNTFIIDDISEEFKVEREKVISRLKIPGDLFLKRGYSQDILKKYDVGLCTEKRKPMSNRVVVPIYDESHQYMIGCSGRTIFPKCPLCHLYHADYYPCPETKIMKSYAQKWKHSYGFSSGNYLYNYWFAKPYIRKYGTAILVEGPADVWRIEEAGYPISLALFGVSISDRQKVLLEQSGVTNLVLFFDPDKAGEKITKTIQEYSHMYNISVVDSDKEPGDLTISEIKERLGKVCKL